MPPLVTCHLSCAAASAIFSPRTSQGRCGGNYGKHRGMGNTNVSIRSFFGQVREVASELTSSRKGVSQNWGVQGHTHHSHSAGIGSHISQRHSTVRNKDGRKATTKLNFTLTSSRCHVILHQLRQAKPKPKHAMRTTQNAQSNPKQPSSSSSPS